jgi:hypothetical protein
MHINRLVRMIRVIRATIWIFIGSFMQSCSNSGTCSVSIGDSSIQFREATDQVGLWRIDSIMCEKDTPYDSTKLNEDDYFAGSCGQLGDTDTELFYQFLMGTLCYPEWSNALKAKANITMTSAFDLFTTR